MIKEADNTEDSLERDGDVITEQPPKGGPGAQPYSGPFEITEISSFDLKDASADERHDWEQSIVAKLKANSRTFSIRLNRRGYTDNTRLRENWTTDDIDAIDTVLCNAIASGSLAKEMLEMVNRKYGGKVASNDHGPLKYSIRDKCPAV